MDDGGVFDFWIVLGGGSNRSSPLLERCVVAVVPPGGDFADVDQEIKERGLPSMASLFAYVSSFAGAGVTASVFGGGFAGDIFK